MAEYVGTKNDAGDLATQADLDKLITAQATAPSSPSVGELWFNTDTGKLYVYYDSFWVDPAGIGAGIKTAAASTITGVNAEGTSNNLARADHNHAISGDNDQLILAGQVFG